MIITKELIDRLRDGDVLKREYDDIISTINYKVCEIWEFICSYSGRKLKWWSFSNDEYDGKGNGSSGGSFDPNEYYEWIEIEGEWSPVSKKHNPYNYGFPTSLLWSEDYVKEVKENIDAADKKSEELKAKQKKDTEEQKQKKQALIESIKNKLTKEELSVIYFKK